MNRNLLLVKNGSLIHPSPLFADSVKQFSFGPPPLRDPNPHRQNCPDVPPPLQHLSSLPNLYVDRSRCSPNRMNTGVGASMQPLSQSSKRKCGLISALSNLNWRCSPREADAIILN